MKSPLCTWHCFHIMWKPQVKADEFPIILSGSNKLQNARALAWLIFQNTPTPSANPIISSLITLTVVCNSSDNKINGGHYFHIWSCMRRWDDCSYSCTSYTAKLGSCLDMNHINHKMGEKESYPWRWISCFTPAHQNWCINNITFHITFILLPVCGCWMLILNIFKQWCNYVQ